MNFFNHYEDFYGKVDLTELHRQGDQLSELAQTIRKRLGKQGYLLDSYLSMVLEGLSDGSVFDVAGRFVIMSSELPKIILDILDGTDKRQEHKLYPKVKDYISTHPLPYQERHTRYNLYLIALIGDYMEHVLTSIIELAEYQKNAYDISEVQNFYRQICSVLGNETQMELLNRLLQQRFQVTTPMSAFVQLFNGTLLSSLIYRDPETDKQIFQLLQE